MTEFKLLGIQLKKLAIFYYFPINQVFHQTLNQEIIEQLNKSVLLNFCLKGGM